MKKLAKVLTTALLTLTVLVGTATNVAAATTVKLNATKVSFVAGKTYTLKATVNGKAAKATWKSSNTSVATISSTGKITAKKAGSATLTATASGKKATCKLTVTAATPKLNVTSSKLDMGKTYTLRATVNGKATSASWKSSNTSVATITSAGKITAKKAGTATLTATVNGKSASCKLTVNAVAPKLNTTSGKLDVGKIYTLKATVNGSAVKATWKSSNTSIATISSTGTITAKKAGTVTLTATVNGKSASCKLTVNPPANTTLKNSSIEAKAKANVSAYNTFIKEVVKYTNQYRAKHGVGALTLDNSLTLVASYRSTEMAQRDELTHTRPDGSKYYDLAKSYDITYRYIGENIGAYQMSAKEVVDAWYASPAHRVNMLSKNFTKIGVGVGMTSDHYYFWTQIFKN